MNSAVKPEEYLARHNVVCLLTPEQALGRGILPVAFLEACARTLAGSGKASFTRQGAFIENYKFVKPYSYSLYDDNNRYIVLESSADMSHWTFHIDQLTTFSPAKAA